MALHGTGKRVSDPSNDNLNAAISQGDQSPGSLYQAAQQATGNVGNAPQVGSNADPIIDMKDPYYNRTMPGEVAPAGPGAGEATTITSSAYKMSEVLDFYWRFNQNEKSSLDAYISRMGSDPSRMSSLQKYDVWKDLVTASVYYQQNGKPFSPWAVAMMEMWGDDKNQGPKTTTATSKTVDLTNRGDAEALLFQASRTLLGRAPTADETDRFLANLNTTEKANPTTVTTTTTRAATGEVTAQDTQRSGGVSDAAKSMQAQKEAQASPEYGAYQAATTYYDAFSSLIRGS